MADIRKRSGSKGTTYQVRFPSPETKTGYAYATFDTLQEARAFREDSRARNAAGPRVREISTVSDAVQKWLDICEKEGRDGRDPVTDYTIKGYQHRANIINQYNWPKSIHELTAPDVIEFRSWLLQTRSRDQAHKVLSSFHSLVLEMVSRGVLAHDIASGVGIRGGSAHTKVREWCTILAKEGTERFGYDGFSRNSLHKTGRPKVTASVDQAIEEMGWEAFVKTI